MGLKDEFNKYYKMRMELQNKKSKEQLRIMNKYNDIVNYEKKLIAERYDCLIDSVFEKLKIEILKNINFKFRQRGFYRTSKGSGYYLRFKGINGNYAIFEITTKAGRRKFKDFKIHIINMNWVEPLNEVNYE